MTAPYTLVKKLYGNVGMMQQGLLEEGDEHRVAPLRRHALQRLIGGLPANLRQPFRPVRIEARKMPLVHTRVVEKHDLRQRRNDMRRGVRDGFLPQPAQQGPSRRRIRLQEAIQ